MYATGSYYYWLAVGSVTVDGVGGRRSYSKSRPMAYPDIFNRFAVTSAASERDVKAQVHDCGVSP